MTNPPPNSFEKEIKNSSQILKEKIGEFTPKVAIILGSGLSKFSDEIDQLQTIQFSELDGFPEPVVGGHRGELGLVWRVAATMYGSLVGVTVLL